MAKLEELQLMENTAIFFAGDNGPDMFKQQSGGSEGLFTGRAAGYWNTGKGSTTPSRPVMIFICRFRCC